MSVAPTAVLLAAAGAAWETEAIDRLARAAPTVTLARRCVDLTDLLAAAGTGLASVAVVSARLPGLDADSVEGLGQAGVRLLLVADAAEAGGHPDEQSDRMRRMGITDLLDEHRLDELVDRVHAAAVDGPPPVADASGSRSLPEVAEGTRPGRLVAVWGPAGAPGRTTVAVALASEIACLDRDAFLLDVDPYGGAVAQHLGVLDEVSGLLGAARAANAGQLDSERLARTARQAGEHLRVLTGLPRADRWREVRAAAFQDLLTTAARLASYVVLDCGFSLESDRPDPFGSPAPQRNETTLTAVSRADEVVVVGAADPVGLARLARGLVELRDTVPDVRPRVVVNRTRPSLGWSDREVRGMVEGFVTPVDVHFVPEDRAAADRALMAGRSLAESGDSALRSALTAVARAVVGEPAPTVRRRRGGRGR